MDDYDAPTTPTTICRFAPHECLRDAHQVMLLVEYEAFWNQFTTDISELMEQVIESAAQNGRPTIYGGIDR